MTTMDETTNETTVVVERRFRGPERTGNGGYTAGLLSRAAFGSVSGPVTVTLRQPPPLEVAMTVAPSSAAESVGGFELRYDDLLVATVVAGAFEAAAPHNVGFDNAAAARPAYRGLVSHPFPGCFVCGVDRQPGDGLRLAPGLYAEGHTACIWVPDLSLASGLERGLVGAEFVWAALDCPGGGTTDIENRPMVLGRITAEVLETPRIGEPVVVVGELLREDGRKTFAASAIYDDDRLLARAEHTWLTVAPTLFT